MPNKKGSKKNKKWAKYRIEVVRSSEGRQKYHWRTIACNGRIVNSSEKMCTINGPKKVIRNLVDAIKKGNFKIVEELVHE